MKQLEPIIKSKGFTYEILERSEFNAIQSQKCNDSGQLVAYEVFRINKNQERVISGVTIAASEGRPSDEQFGTSAWCYAVFSTDGTSALAKAKAKFQELEQKQSDKLNQAA